MVQFVTNHVVKNGARYVISYFLWIEVMLMPVVSCGTSTGSSSSFKMGLLKYRYLMQCVAPTHDAVTHTVTHTPKYIFLADLEQKEFEHDFNLEASPVGAGL